MANGTLKVGDTVSWRGAWGSEPAKRAKVEHIEHNCVAKYGDETREVPWSEVRTGGRSVVVTLDNGHWAYGDQLSPL